MKLMMQALGKMLSGLVVMGLLLFLPAGTVRYPRGWLLMGLLFLPMAAVGLVLWRKAPELLQKRLHTQETQKDQVAVVALSSVEFILCFLAAGLEFRWLGGLVPLWITWVAAVVFLLGYGLYVEVLRENAYLSRTVEVQENQKVVDTGLYGLVRHPMYFATVLLFWAMPLVLGSLTAFLVMLPYPLLLIKRIRNEEQVLREGLAGYTAYCEKVKYRLLPFIW